MNADMDPRAIEVLDRALCSSSRMTRLRAVAMLSRVECARRTAWLERALEDCDAGVRDAALSVLAWTIAVAEPPWPAREDPAFDQVPPLAEQDSALEESAALSWAWEYAVEVWRADGLLVGVFLSTSCEEDDQHAKRIALGQAVLASTSPGGDPFEPATAAAFVVGKRQIRRGACPPRGRQGRRRDGP